MHKLLLLIFLPQLMDGLHNLKKLKKINQSMKIYNEKKTQFNSLPIVVIIDILYIHESINDQRV